MDTSPLPQAKHTVQPQRLPYHKKAQSQTTIDFYLKPVTKVRQGQNDIRSYFPPVAKTKELQNSESTNSSSLVKTRATSRQSHKHNDATQSQASVSRPSAKVPVENIRSIPDGTRGKSAPGVAIKPRNHTHANSAVLPNFVSLFDNPDFSHSTSPMAPRATNIMRHSLLPKPLNIKIPLPPAEETGISPSQITSSPSSAGDADTASLDDEIREAPSFKQTYVSVHSRHNTNDNGPISPLMALRDSSLRPLNQRAERPGAPRSKTVPLLSEQGCADSVIYFLPKISPTEESETEERRSVGKSRYPSSVKKVKAERQAVGSEEDRLGQMEKRGDAERQNAMAVSPGKDDIKSTSRIEFCC